MKLLRYIFSLLFFICALDSYAQLNHKHFILMGRIDLSEENYSEAIQNFNMAIIAKPKDFEAYFLRGIAKFSLNDFNGAVSDFDKTLEIHPLYVRAYHYRGISNDRLENYADAKKDFERAISLDPYDPALHIALGSTMIHLNEFKNAIECFDTALIINPNDANAYINRGVAKRLIDDLDGALHDLNKAVYNDYFNVEALVRRGMIQMERNEYKDAMIDFNQALKMDKDNPIIYFNRGTVFLNLGDTISALKDYEKVNNIDERNALTYFNRAIIYGLLNENDIALALFDKVIEINPVNVYGYFNRGILHYKMGELDYAEADFTKVIELFPDFIDAWVNRSVVRHEKGDEIGSEQDRYKSMEIINLVSENDKNIDSLYNLYSKSIDYDKIIAFESDFSSGDKGGKYSQFSSVDIKPFGNFIVGVVEFNSKHRNKSKNKFFIDATLSQINENLSSFQLAYIRNEIFRDNYESLLNDSVVESVEDPELKTLLMGILNYELFNFRRAEDCFVSLIGNEIYNVYSVIDLASLQQTRAELTLVDHSVVDHVTINQKKMANDGGNIKTHEKPDYSLALNTLMALLDEDYDNPFIWYNLGNVHLQMQEFHKAIDDYSKAIEYEQNLAEAYYNRGLTLIYLGENELAGEDLSKAGELGIKEAYAVIKRFLNK